MHCESTDASAVETFFSTYSVKLKLDLEDKTINNVGKLFLVGSNPGVHSIRVWVYVGMCTDDPSSTSLGARLQAKYQNNNSVLQSTIHETKSDLYKGEEEQGLQLQSR